MYNFFSVHQNCKTKKFAISKILNTKFCKIHYFANIKYKRNSQKYCGKNLRNFCEKKNFRQKKLVEKNFRKKNVSKKNRKKFEK